jgi:hypothetical protein
MEEDEGTRNTYRTISRPGKSLVVKLKKGRVDKT